MHHKFLQEMQKLQQLRENTGWIELTELEESVHIYHSSIPQEEVLSFLTENNFEYDIIEGELFVNDSMDELIEELTEYELFNSSATAILEGSAKRKIVVRKGKRKVIFQCPPGQKKIGRRCAKRASKDLLKMKRRAKRAARKAKRKRSQANRRRKISLRKRPRKAHHKHEK